MDRQEWFKTLQAITPSWKPAEECTPEEQEAAYDSTFDWDDDEE